jgi:oligopeptide transport system substrate-binding protein
MRLFAPIVVLAALLGAMSWFDDTRPRADVVMVHRVDVFTLDPQRMSYQQDLRVAMALYEGVAALENRTCKAAPGVAESWEISPDGKRYVFRLRENARWSNGDPVTAHDFVFAWRRAILPDTAVEYSGQFMTIRGAPEFFEWRNRKLREFAAGPKGETAAKALWAETVKRFDETVGLRAPDSRTFEIELSQPVAFFLDLCTFGVFSPVHRPTLERFTRIDPATGRVEEDPEWTRPEHHVTNGPYRLAQWRAKRDLRLEPNEFYWNKAAMRNGSVTVATVEDPNTAVLMFESGEADWLTDVIVEYRADMLAQRRRYEDRHAETIARRESQGLSIDETLARLPAPRRGERRNIHAFPAFGTDFYSFNCRPQLNDGRVNPFADARVRRAFALAIDKQAIVTRITRLNERIAATLVPVGSIPGYESPLGLPFDPKRAREELASAGWVDRDGDGFVEDASGNRFLTVEILYASGNSRYEDISLALRDMWRQTLGVACEVRNREARARKDDLIGGDFIVGSGGWYGDYGDPTTWLDLSKTGDGNNDRGYSNAKFDAMLAAAAAEVDVQKRLDILSDAERFLMEEELPIAPICQFVTVYMYEPGKFTGLTSHPRLEQFAHLLKRESDK